MDETNQEEDFLSPLRPSATFLPSGTYDRLQEARRTQERQSREEDGARVAAFYSALLKDNTLKKAKQKKKGGHVQSAVKSQTPENPAEAKEEFYCKVCKQTVIGMPREHHERLTPHQLELTKELHEEDPSAATRLVNYHIETDNVGFKMLEAGGWAQQEGLGKEGQGRKVPVPAVVKHDRLGVGIRKPGKKVLVGEKPRVTPPAKPVKPIKVVKIMKPGKYSRFRKSSRKGGR